VVIGLIAVLISLLLPVVNRVRAAANAAACLANVRQMNTAWTIYLTENRGRLPHYMQSSPGTEIAYRGYWLGILENYRVRGESLLCPAAREPIPYSQPGNNKGAGNVNYAWSGKWMTPFSVGRLNTKIYREGSYGYNDRLTIENKFNIDVPVTRINQIRNLTEVPVFFDCAMLDAHPDNGNLNFPAQPPHDLNGEFPAVGGEAHWRFMLARHGRAINFGFADGSARRIPLEETYMLQWGAQWVKYTLTLPPY